MYGSFRSVVVLFAIAFSASVGCGDDDAADGGDDPTDGDPVIDAGADGVDGGPVDGGVSPIDGGADDAGAVDAGQPDAGPVGETEFFSSFEEGEPQPTWINTVEVDRAGRERASGVNGPSPGILGNIMDQVVAVSASGENAGSGEVAGNVADGELTTKWLVFQNVGWVQVTLAEPVAVRRYAVSSANDAPERDPRDWALQGSLDGASWTAVDIQVDRMFGARFETQVFEVENEAAYLHYRFNVTRNRSGGSSNIVQMAELQLSNGDDTPPSATPMRSTLGRGPGASWNAKLGAGFTGVRAFRFAGAVPAAGRGYSYNKIFEVDVRVTPTTELSYLLFVDEAALDPSYPGTYAAVDLAFADGTYLSDYGAVDQHFAALTPAGQGASRTLYPAEWNRKTARIGDVAAGRTIRRILIGYDNPNGPVASFGGWVDDIRITAQPEPPPPAHLSDHVLTTRGTNSSGGYSRGNNIPATAVPHGFNFWTPVTDAGSQRWIYEYHRRNNADNLPRLEALSLSHEPSPWMGDRQSFQVLPSAADGTPPGARGDRALPFRHENEIARPYYYGVLFENGIRAEIAPTDHAAMFRFTFPGDSASLVFDNVDNQGGLTLDPAGGALSAYSDARSELSAGATRLFVYAVFDRPVVESGTLPGTGRPSVAGFYRFAVEPGQRTVTMRIATSLISVEQARRNLELEIAAGDSFDGVAGRAQALWDAKLGIVELEGATRDQLTTFYSNMYRLFLYPNSGFENTGTADAPVYRHASPVLPAGPNTPTETGAQVVDGKIYVNNGFWDTYRATWPAYALLTPTQTGEMIDGFVQQFREGGWVARWSSPGYADLMTGTSSDVAFADAYLKGVTNFDAEAAYDAALRNATVASQSPATGRKGLDRSIFLGYTPTQTGEGFSWAMAGYLNDFGIANMAEKLADGAGDRAGQLLEEAEYFRERSQNYVHLFDPSIQFFQGRAIAGGFRLPAGSYDPRVWGFDYTETNGWNMAFDVPHDGLGLAALYGGQAELAAKLDAFFATPETAGFPGSYNGIIHEMREARDVRMGQLGLSNQPAFHTIYMYDYASQPYKTQEKVRDALARLWVGSEIGQGYLGDEDNGATAAWQIFSALGFYPLQVGSPHYVIGSPLFTKATIHLENGRDIVISAPDNGPGNVYVLGLRVNGEPYFKTYLPHTLLADGATLEFLMSSEPSSWGTGSEDEPPSLTTGEEVPRPLADTVRGPGVVTEASDGTDTTGLFDDNSTTSVGFSAADPSVLVHFTQSSPAIEFYTLTSAAAEADPTAWSLYGSDDGESWVLLDDRQDQTFRWRRQTRPFKVATPVAYAFYRLDLVGPPGTSLAEVELLAEGGLEQ